MPSRTFSSGSYRYGFNGKENDKDISEGGQDYGLRIYDDRLGKFLSVDPLTKKYPELTPYQFATNRPVDGIDLDGAEYLSNKGSSLQSQWNIQLKLIDTKKVIQTSVSTSSSKPQISIKELFDEKFYTKLEINKDGDQSGLFKNATSEEYSANPVNATVKDGSHLVLEFFGLNAADDFVADRQAGKNSPAEITMGLINLGIATSHEGEAPKGGTRALIHKNSFSAEGDFLLYNVHSEPSKGGILLKVGKANAEKLRADGTPDRMTVSQREARKKGYPNATATIRKKLGKTTTGDAVNAEAKEVVGERAKGNELPLNREKNKKYKE